VSARRAYTLLLAVAVCCSQGGRRPNVLLIVIDTLRADRLGSYGNSRGLTPFLDDLSKKGVVFQNAYAPSSWTVPSIASLFTSRYPSQHRVTTFESRVSADEITLAEKLIAHGFMTAGFSANFRLNDRLGYAQGFQDWHAFTNGAPDRGKVRGSAVRERSLTWLQQLGKRAAVTPTFLYLHYMEPHAPYQPVEPYRSRLAREHPDADPSVANGEINTINFKTFSTAEVELLESLYDAEVASVDAELRAMFAALERTGVLDNAIIVITADHGEEFREHGRMTHGHALYNESIRVPLILLAPGIAAGRVVTDSVSLIDVAPTIMDLLGLPSETRFEGRSLLPLLKDHSPTNQLIENGQPPPDVIVELPKTGSRFDIRGHSQAIVRDSVKLLMALKGRKKLEFAEIYDLADDPGETNPNPKAIAKQIPKLRTALRQRRQALAASANLDPETVPIDAATKERLRALGYTF
jgi:arylsulfatase A-like enzyme